MIVNILGWQGLFMIFLLFWRLTDDKVSQTALVFYKLAIFGNVLFQLFACLAIGISFFRLKKLQQ